MEIFTILLNLALSLKTIEIKGGRIGLHLYRIFGTFRLGRDQLEDPLHVLPDPLGPNLRVSCGDAHKDLK